MLQALNSLLKTGLRVEFVPQYKAEHNSEQLTEHKFRRRVRILKTSCNTEWTWHCVLWKETRSRTQAPSRHFASSETAKC
jgi:hypothetical protein